jgi:hypothetical protein
MQCRPSRPAAAAAAAAASVAAGAAAAVAVAAAVAAAVAEVGNQWGERSITGCLGQSVIQATIEQARIAGAAAACAYYDSFSTFEAKLLHNGLVAAMLGGTAAEMQQFLLSLNDDRVRSFEDVLLNGFAACTSEECAIYRSFAGTE